MKASITIIVETMEQAAAVLAVAFESGATVAGKTAKPATGKGKPAAKPPEDDMDLGFGDDNTETEEAKTVDDVISAMKAYAEANDRKAAQAILKKFKVKSVHDLEEGDIPKILKLLEA